MKINAIKTIQVDAKILKIHLKCSDSFSAALIDEHGSKLVDYEGYVPDFMPGEHHGDYLILDIEIDTGKILNWKVPSASRIESFIKVDE